MINNSRYRYPIERTRYTQSVGRLLPHRISQIFQELGFETWISQGQSNGVDLKVYDTKDHLILVAEVFNWSSYSSLAENRKNNIINNLSEFKCKRLLIYTCFENENCLSDLSNHSISCLKIGYQILPEYFYNFYSRKNQMESRKIDSKETKADIKSRIIEYLQYSGIIISSISGFCDFQGYKFATKRFRR